MGCEKVDKTRMSKDAGIDFFGTLNLSKMPVLHRKISDSLINTKLHFIGQAKRYSKLNIIRPEHIREFLGAIVLLDYTQAWGIDSQLNINNLPKRYLKIREPRISIYITTSFASDSASDIARELGIIILDGEDLARWLASKEFVKKVEDQYDLKIEIDKWIRS